MSKTARGLLVLAGLELALSALPSPAVADQAPVMAEAPTQPGETFRDCEACPDLVVIPGGAFVLGSDQGRPDEAPALPVQFDRPFALGVTEVTFHQWQACVDDGACQHRPGDQGWGRAGRPVIDVSWDDAQAYLAWLSAKTGATYRLPTEAEWEYAARAGTTSEYWWGDKHGDGAASYCGSKWDTKQTAPVASFPANPFGLHDVHGNVWEWTANCYSQSGYSRASIDGEAGQISCRRVLRGGSWQTYPLLLRAARRYPADQGGRYSDAGIRVLRELAPDDRAPQTAAQ